MFCAAPTVLIGIANAPAELRQGARAGLRVLTAGAPPAAATIATRRGRARLGGHPGLRPDRDRAVHHRLRAAPRARGALAGRPGHHQSVPGRRADHLRRAAGRGRRRQRGPARRPDPRRDHGARQRGDEGLLQRPGRHRRRHPRRLVLHRRRGGGPPGRLRRDPRPPQGRHHQRRREHLVGRGRGRPDPPPGRPGGRRRRAAGRALGRGAARLRGAQAGRLGHGGRAAAVRPRQHGPLQGPAGLPLRRRSCRRPRPGKIQKYVLRGGRAAIARQ